MPKFRFECIDDDNVITTKTFDTAYLQECVENTQDFLHGCGFVFDELSYTKANNEEDGESSIEQLDREGDRILLNELVKPNKSTITGWTATD
jgi:hypothetical protein